MPVTITPSSHKARAFGYTAGLATDAKTLLDRALQTSIPEDVIIHQSTWGHGAAALPGSIISSANGFVDTLMHAYGQHHHLVLRPEDLWFAILTQFALYVNANGEELRSHFVAHEGKKILRLEYMPFDIRTFDFRVFANQMGQLLGDVVVDATLREWIMPDFSTTDDNDRVVAAIVMMGTLQTYFIYSCGIICGFPTVELLGEKADYEAILGRLDKLEEYGAEPSQFAALLRPVLRRFVRSFEAPEAEDVVKFWRTAFDLDDSVCGITIYTGWITAFTFWDAKGKRLQPMPDKSSGDDDDFPLADSFQVRQLVLDGIKYHPVNGDKVAPAYTKVPVIVEDLGGDVDCEMFAGMLGVGLSSRGGPHVDIRVSEPDGQQQQPLAQDAQQREKLEAPLDTMAPVVGWCISEATTSKPEAQEEKEKDESDRGWAGLEARLTKMGIASAQRAKAIGSRPQK